MSEDRPPQAAPADPDGAMEALPGVARIAASSWWHTTEWALQTSARAGRRLLQVAVHPETAPDLAEDVRDLFREYARELVGLADTDPGPGAGDGPAAEAEEEWAELRARGAEVLRRSRDVHHEDTAHPAYDRIVGELAPDEARILRLLMLQGPQPAIDIRTGGPLALLNSRLIAPGFSMLGARAGCRYPSRVPGYLNNLFRLGMIWFSRETLRDPVRYQVLEAQPEVLAATKSVRIAKVVRRSIHLTPFGEDFCRVCLALETDELVELPEHADPEEETKEPQPPDQLVAPFQPRAHELGERP